MVSGIAGIPRCIPQGCSIRTDWTAMQQQKPSPGNTVQQLKYLLPLSFLTNLDKKRVLENTNRKIFHDSAFLVLHASNSNSHPPVHTLEMTSQQLLKLIHPTQRNLIKST